MNQTTEEHNCVRVQCFRCFPDRNIGNRRLSSNYSVVPAWRVLLHMWAFKETEYQQLLSVRFLAGGGFAALSVVLAVTAVGWFQYRRWAWFLSSTILAANLVSDVHLRL